MFIVYCFLIYISMPPVSCRSKFG